MTIPKFDETMYPLLNFIKDEKEYNVRVISDQVRDNYFTLTEDEKKEKVSNGKTRFHDRLT
ncbi:MAG TPA: hypothetical protein EYG72_02630 [Candidatus Pacebacteria bacterium]|nr:hypothetical protein [Candidatus Paceibacterota bacterium]